MLQRGQPDDESGSKAEVETLRKQGVRGHAAARRPVDCELTPGRSPNPAQFYFNAGWLSEAETTFQQAFGPGIAASTKGGPATHWCRCRAWAPCCWRRESTRRRSGPCAEPASERLARRTQRSRPLHRVRVPGPARCPKPGRRKRPSRSSRRRGRRGHLIVAVPRPAGAVARRVSAWLICPGVEKIVAPCFVCHGAARRGQAGRRVGHRQARLLNSQSGRSGMPGGADATGPAEQQSGRGKRPSASPRALSRANGQRNVLRPQGAFPRRARLAEQWGTHKKEELPPIAGNLALRPSGGRSRALRGLSWPVMSAVRRLRRGFGAHRDRSLAALRRRAGDKAPAPAYHAARRSSPLCRRGRGANGEPGRCRHHRRRRRQESAGRRFLTPRRSPCWECKRRGPRGRSCRPPAGSPWGSINRCGRRSAKRLDLAHRALTAGPAWPFPLGGLADGQGPLPRRGKANRDVVTGRAILDDAPPKPGAGASCSPIPTTMLLAHGLQVGIHWAIGPSFSASRWEETRTRGCWPGHAPGGSRPVEAVTRSPDVVARAMTSMPHPPQSRQRCSWKTPSRPWH